MTDDTRDRIDLDAALARHRADAAYSAGFFHGLAAGVGLALAAFLVCSVVARFL